jgi:hypothetical protein
MKHLNDHVEISISNRHEIGIHPIAQDHCISFRNGNKCTESIPQSASLFVLLIRCCGLHALLQILDE